MTARAHIGDIAVFCKYDELASVEDLSEHPLNPNKHSPEQITLLAEIIKELGWRQAIVVSSLSGYIIKGHCRLAAAQKLGLKEVPVEFQGYESEAAENADLLADNRVAELSFLDQGEIEKMMVNLREFDFFRGFEGFSDEKFSGYIGKLVEEGYSSQSAAKDGGTVTFVVPLEYEELMKSYLQLHGKKGMVDMIVNICKGDAA